MRPQRDAMCYRLDSYGLGSGSRQVWWLFLRKVYGDCFEEGGFNAPVKVALCYRLDSDGLGSGSRQRWYQSLTNCRITKPNWSKLSLELL